MQTSEIIRQIITGNENFISEHTENYFSSYSEKQTPYITMVSCSDSRVPMNAIMPDTVNKIFKVENIGNQILSTEGSVDFGVYHLKTPVLMIMGHSDCGAIKAYMRGFNEETYNIKRELDFMLPIIKKNENDVDFQHELSRTIEKNIDYQAKIAYRKYKDLVVKDKLTIIGAYYDFTNDFGKGKGCVIITNVNKEKHISDIVKMPFFENITEAEKEFFIGRI